MGRTHKLFIKKGILMAGKRKFYAYLAGLVWSGVLVGYALHKGVEPDFMGLAILLGALLAVFTGGNVAAKFGKKS